MVIAGRRAILIVSALVVSACLNLFALGDIAGRMFHSPQRHGYGFGMGRLLENVPDDVKPLLRQAMDDRRNELSERAQGVKAARRAVADTLRQPALDIEAVEKSLSTLRTRDNEMREYVHGVLIDVLRNLPPEAREKWAQEWGKNRD